MFKINATAMIKSRSRLSPGSKNSIINSRSEIIGPSARVNPSVNKKGELRISAVMPVYNESDIIHSALNYLIGQNIYVELLDNESTDATVKIARQFPESSIGISSFSSGGEFNEKLLGEAVQSALHRLDGKSDWLLKIDADEFIESPFSGMSLRDGIELADQSGANCIGVRSFCFYPMSFEAPHIAGNDVRRFYNYYRIWDKVDRWTPDFHPQYNELWKINMFKSNGGVFYQDAHKVEPYENINLFPDLFILRHYPYRDPERTSIRLVTERRDRMSKWNIDNNVSCHYVKYSEKDSFFYDSEFESMSLWSELEKPTWNSGIPRS